MQCRVSSSGTKVDVPRSLPCTSVSRTRKLSRTSVAPFYWTAFVLFDIFVKSDAHYCICKFRKLAGLANQ